MGSGSHCHGPTATVPYRRIEQEVNHSERSPSLGRSCYPRPWAVSWASWPCNGLYNCLRAMKKTNRNLPPIMFCCFFLLLPLFLPSSSSVLRFPDSLARIRAVSAKLSSRTLTVCFLNYNSLSSIYLQGIDVFLCKRQYPCPIFT